MPRDAGGTYSLPPSNPVVTNTPILANGWANPTLSDLATEMTNSLDRSGRGGMTGPLSIYDGAGVGVPGLRFIADQDNGIRRAGADDWRLVAGGLDIAGVNAAQGLVRMADGSPYASVAQSLALATQEAIVYAVALG